MHVAEARPRIAAKRAAQREAIVEATMAAIRKHGYAATSLQRIAEEAGTSKRMVHYYFETREQLFDEVVRTVCARVLAQVESAVSVADDPAAALSEAMDQLWFEVTSDPGLQAVFFSLLAESVTHPGLRRTISAVRNDYRELIARTVALPGRSGKRELERQDSIATFFLATFAGLTVDFLERGDTPSLQRAMADFKVHLASMVGAGS